jgi:hypothetical protein
VTFHSRNRVEDGHWIVKDLKDWVTKEGFTLTFPGAP